MRNSRKTERAGCVNDDLAFPVPFREQAKYLELADRFIEMDQRGNGRGNVIPIDRGRRSGNVKLRRVS
jgi:hypothetical protein